jgi:hypothetical protein
MADPKSPTRSVVRGVESDRGRVGVLHGDEDLWEIFIHASRVLDQAAGLYDAAGLSAPVVGDDDAFNVAWRACEKAQAHYVKTVTEAITARKAVDAEKPRPQGPAKQT